jgi:hypothetical protein
VQQKLIDNRRDAKFAEKNQRFLERLPCVLCAFAVFQGNVLPQAKLK